MKGRASACVKAVVNPPPGRRGGRPSGPPAPSWTCTPAASSARPPPRKRLSKRLTRPHAMLRRKRLTIPHRVSQAGLWEMWQRWGYECDESYATARGGAA